MPENRVDFVRDPNSDLTCALTILKGSDGGAGSVQIELHNDGSRDVLLKVNRELSAMIMLTVTDSNGIVLSQPAKKFRTSEEQQFQMARIPPGRSHSWQVPFTPHLSAEQLPEKGMKGRLVVNVALLFRKNQDHDESGENEFASSLMTLYDMDVLFTRASLT